MTHTVLVPEDDLANVRLMERRFQRPSGVRLLTAMQGSLGVELAREHQPDLIILPPTCRTSPERMSCNSSARTLTCEISW